MAAKTALITGSTSGIGLAFTKLLVREKYNLVLVSSDLSRLEKERDAILRTNPHLSVQVYCEDLSERDAATRLYNRVSKDGHRIDLLINNAGFGLTGPAQSLDMEREQKMLQLLVVTPTELCKWYLAEMYRRGKGVILNVASTGAFQPGPYTASYFASKSYLCQYSQAIRLEAKKYGVQVFTLCPGTTRTKFFRKTGRHTPLWAMSPDKVAQQAWKGMKDGKALIVPGMLNRLLCLVPAGIKARGVAFLKKSIK